MSYFDSDLGYDLGYDTDSITSPNLSAPTQAQAPSTGVVYRMDPPGSVTSTSDRWAQRLQAILHNLEGEGPAGIAPSSSEDQSRAAGDLALLEGRSGGSEATARPASEGGEGSTSTAEVRSGASTRTMEEIAGDTGTLASLPGGHWNPGSRAAFREQYAARSEEDLRAMLRPQRVAGTDRLETQEEVSERVFNATRNDFIGDTAARIRGRFAPGTISEEESTLLAHEAIRQNMTEPHWDNFQPGRTREAVYGTVDRIPRGSREANMEIPLYRDAVMRERRQFAESAVEVFRGIDGRHYRGAAGERRATQDANLFLFEQGIADDLEGIHRRRTRGAESPESLEADLRGFYNRAGTGPTRPGERPNEYRRPLMERAGVSALDTSGMTRRGREEVAIAELNNDAARERDRVNNAAQDARSEREQRMATARGILEHEMDMEEADQAHAHRLGETMFSQGLQMLGQMINSSMEAIHQATRGILEATNQMITVRPMSVPEAMAMVRNQQPPAA